MRLPLTGQLRLAKLNKPWIWAIPGVIHCILILTNIFTGAFFYFDQAGAYFRGPLFIVHYISPALYLLGMGGLAVYFHKRLKYLQVVAVVSVSVFTFAAVVAQFFFLNIMLVGAATSASMMMLYLSLQNPSDHIDSLTGSFNNAAFINLCNSYFEDEKKFFFLGIRVNGLKTYNSIFGVENCDLLLRDIAEYLRGINIHTHHFRITSSTLAVIAYKHEVAEEIIQKLSSRFRRPWTINGVDVKLNISVSSIEIPKFAASLESILTNMDYCMMKLDDVNRSSCFIEVDDEILHEIAHTVAIEGAIERAIDNESFEVWYQPIYSVKEKRVTSAEALIRLNDPVLGWISPELFIPLAEKNGHILQIGNIVLRKVCEFVSRVDMKALGIEMIDVNLSVVECMQENLCSDIFRTIHSYNVAPELIHFEITETAASNSMDNLKQVMETILAGGCEFSIDDYGTGYANLNSILELPFYMIKLDKSLLWSYGTSSRSDIILNHVIRMAKEMQMLILAEGVETWEQFLLIKEKEIDYVQGYYFSKPLPETGFADYILNQEWEAKRTE